LRSRSLLFADWRFNAEVRSAITVALERHRAGLG
jgi:hypothetical protein